MKSQWIDFITTSIEAAIQPELWDKSLDLIVQEFDCRSGTLLALNNGYQPGQVVAMSRFFREDGLKAVSKFNRGDDADDIKTYLKMFELSENHIVSECELYQVEDIENLPYSRFRDFMHDSLGIKQRYPTKLNRIGCWIDALILHTKEDKPVLNGIERGEINGLSQILSSSLKSFRAMQQLQSQFSATLSALDNLGIACFLTISNAQVIHRNLAAEDLLADDDGIFVGRNGKLSISNGDLTSIIEHACEKAYHTACGEDICNEFVAKIPRPSRRADYLVTVNPVIDARAELQQDMRSALVYVVDSTVHRDISAQGLKVLGELTEAETAICTMLLRGYSTRQIMERRNTSENTVRQQIKTILSKLKCSNRIDLLRLAVDTHLPIKEVK